MKSLRCRCVLLAGLAWGSVFGAASQPAAFENIGVGLLFGFPSSGISVKLPMSPSTSLNGLLGYDLQHTDLYTRFEYVWYQYDLIPVPKGRLPLYYGPGVHASTGSHSNGGVGVHGVVGIEYQLPSDPLDFFFEVAPGINILPNTNPAISVGLGGRFFF